MSRIAPKTSPPSRPNHLEQATVLVVEDDPTLRSVLLFNLARENYRVLTAADGEAGLTMARTEGGNLDLVLLDVMLPGLNGFQVLRQLRLESDVPVLMLSARSDIDDRVTGLELGADDYIPKPFSLPELMARVRAAIRRRSMPSVRPPTVIQRGPLRIEPDRRQAAVEDNLLQLRPKEFGVLVMLALEPERVFSRKELIQHVWGTDIYVDERTVDVHVSWLRGKLHKAGIRENPILTVYGSGYRFRTPIQKSKEVVEMGADSGDEEGHRARQDGLDGLLHA